jgi:hypothetical protein
MEPLPDYLYLRRHDLGGSVIFSGAELRGGPWGLFHLTRYHAQRVSSPGSPELFSNHSITEHPKASPKVQRFQGAEGADLGDHF